MLSKSPASTGRIRSLRETFPDARFVYILRNPAVSIASTYSMFATARARSGFPALNPDQVRDAYDAVCYMYQHAFDELARLPKTDYCIVEYEQLLSDPQKLMHRIYDTLGLRFSAAFEQRLHDATAAAKQYSSQHHYPLEVVGLTTEDVRASLPFIFDRYQFAEASDAGQTAAKLS